MFIKNRKRSLATNVVKMITIGAEVVPQQKHKTINHKYYCWVVLAVSGIPRKILKLWN